ncbi:MAG: signal recognition particle-docking protein FtsY [Candidatus Aminicenantes bacterium]|nr:signal recognition particle-docking protein FtsY [Candidatus Aminicenantes bacterium]
MKLKNIFGSSLNLKEKLGRILGGKKSKEEIFEEVEELLILSDISAGLVNRILANARKKSPSIAAFTRDDFFTLLKDEIKAIFAAIPGADAAAVPTSDEKNVIVLVGVNGSGKTTSAAKLAHYYREKGRKVLLSAADTFRAAGSSQLSLWGERLGIPVIGGERGADPGSVVYNSLNSFTSKDHDLLIIDTAGRVQTRENLMKELEKLTKIIKKFYPDGPTETLLVIDATMGQNTLDQAKKFKEFSGISGIFLAKLDGTAKGGTVINIVDEMRIPVKFVGTGEKQDDVVPFSVDEFIDSIFSD